MIRYGNYINGTSDNRVPRNISQNKQVQDKLEELSISHIIPNASYNTFSPEYIAITFYTRQ